MYDFQLVINTNFLPILHRFQDIAFETSKIATWLPLLHLILPLMKGSLHHIIVSDILLKVEVWTIFLIFLSQKVWEYLQPLLRIAPRMLPISLK